MFLRATTRKKDGKTHRYWSIVENRRLTDGRVLQRHVLYLGEINDSQARAWRRSIEVLDEREDAPRTVALFPEDRIDECGLDASVVRLRLSHLRLCHPRVWGSCWLALKLWERLELDRFWSQRLLRSRKGTRWEQVLFVLVAYRLLSPGSEWRLHRHWFEGSALKDLLGADELLGDIHKLYACHDRILGPFPQRYTKSHSVCMQVMAFGLRDDFVYFPMVTASDRPVVVNCCQLRSNSNLL